MSKINFKTPILLWVAKGNNSRRNEDSVIDAARAEIPELKHLSKDRNQTILDYFRRYQAGMRAAEPKTKAEPKVKAAPVNKETVKPKKAAAKKPAKKVPVKTSSARLYIQSPKKSK